MEREKSIELLNGAYEFPCVVTIKVIGALADDFVGRVLAAVQEESDDFPYSTRSTPNEKHVAITMEPTLKSAEQVLAIYERVSMLRGVVMTM